MGPWRDGRWAGVLATIMASLIDLHVPENARVIDQQTQEIDIPGQCVVAAIIREEDFVVPRGSTEVLGGDHVGFVGPSDAVKTAREILSEQAEAAS